jgi:hypothetical protein
MRVAALILTSVVVAGCGKGDSTPSAASSSAPASSSAAAPPTASAAPANSFGAPIGAPIAVDKVMAAINPKHEPPYAGPTGTLKGKIRIDGDPPPPTRLKFPDRCKDSVVAYDKIFRVGLDKALADALVAVTNYGDRGWVPAREEAVKVTLHGCAPEKLTYGVTFGQRLDAFNTDKVASYMPYLDGTPAKTIMVAIPGGVPVKIYPGPKSPARYMLRDQLDSGLTAQVLVLNYATHDVTGLDGRYEIKGIPVGKVQVGVFLPVIEKSEQQEIEIKEGENTLDVTLHFDAKKDIPHKGAPAASGSASAGPATPPKAPPAPH